MRAIENLLRCAVNNVIVLDHRLVRIDLAHVTFNLNQLLVRTIVLSLDVLNWTISEKLAQLIVCSCCTDNIRGIDERCCGGDRCRLARLSCLSKSLQLLQL